jgi:D-alanyl-D-alanine carboxypeptidase (penicillin-binding protein 5/6)
MNEKAKLIGATNTNFINSYGLHEQNHIRSWDCYVISEYATRDQNLMDILNAQQYTIAASSFRPKGDFFYTNNHLISGFKTAAYTTDMQEVL